MSKQLLSIISRVLFIGSFLISGMAVLEKIANMMGMTFMRGHYTSWHLLEFAAVALLFVIAIQLRQMKGILEDKNK